MVAVVVHMYKNAIYNTLYMCVVVGMQFNENVPPLPCTCSHTGNATLRRLYGQVSHALSVICHIIQHTQLFVSSELPEEELKQDEEDEQAKEKDL